MRNATFLPFLAATSSSMVVSAFTAVRPTFSPFHRSNNRDGLVRSKSRNAPMKMALDPHSFSSFLVSVDPAIQAIQGVVDTAASSVAPAVDTTQAAMAPASAAADAAATSTGNGWFGFLTGPIEGLIQIIHNGLVRVGVDENAWGVSIVGMTVLIKILTYPLTRQQLQSTNKMQVLQPKVKEIQTTYQSNPEVMNQKIAELYQQENVNPLAGCIPALVQLPVFIGLYRAILTLSKDDKLSEPFLWLPNLEGPTYGADPTHGSDWILKGWVDGTPSLGWDATIAFLSLPVLLVISQFISQALITPKNSEQQGNFVIKLLPLLIGWFSLNVPAALGIYWVANNVITTLLTLQIRSSMETAPAAAGGGGGPSAPGATMEPPPTVFRPAPMREKPSGFAGAPPPTTTSPDDVKPITPIDAEIISPESDAGAGAGAAEAESSGTPITTPTPSKKRGKKKKKRRN